ncbi:hypothetical protein KR51_00008180 [Rubidibacter lacunae KORDI 51-2]|uniref:Uncharacterized protein n=1 Tax=Rubidibacter lacunae KORDI 51-2 TaxID=582515 RepID=U5DNR0_9CHRO|nr:hypothetical protein [Rubidibacter lacunae]ERN42502.1 hypothetical protein KR51_00008180 [Rubidibacter lacunae KORDI 51-2]
MSDPKIWAAFVSGGFALAGTIYVAILNHFSRKEHQRFKAATDEKLATFRANVGKDIARFEAQTAKELAKLNADFQNERDERLAKQQSEKVLSKFRAPLLQAAYDLQSRIFNILKLEFLPTFYSNGSDLEQEYAVENTVFLLAQFLGWTELIRQEIQFLDLRSDEETRKLRSLQDSIFTRLRTDKFGQGFRLFAGEQRAVGELMIDRTGELPRCIGFATFLTDRNPNLDRWLDLLREDVKKMAADVKPYEKRLISIQHSLIDLLEFLDRNYVYFPMKSRLKI